MLWSRFMQPPWFSGANPSGAFIVYDDSALGSALAIFSRSIIELLFLQSTEQHEEWEHLHDIADDNGGREIAILYEQPRHERSQYCDELKHLGGTIKWHSFRQKKGCIEAKIDKKYYECIIYQPDAPPRECKPWLCFLLTVETPDYSIDGATCTGPGVVSTRNAIKVSRCLVASVAQTMILFTVSVWRSPRH